MVHYIPDNLRINYNKYLCRTMWWIFYLSKLPETLWGLDFVYAELILNFHLPSLKDYSTVCVPLQKWRPPQETPDMLLITCLTCRCLDDSSGQCMKPSDEQTASSDPKQSLNTHNHSPCDKDYLLIWTHLCYRENSMGRCFGSTAKRSRGNSRTMSLCCAGSTLGPQELEGSLGFFVVCFPVTQSR